MCNEDCICTHEKPQKLSSKFEQNTSRDRKNVSQLDSVTDAF